MTGLTVERVDVRIVGIAVDKPQKPQKTQKAVRIVRK